MKKFEEKELQQDYNKELKKGKHTLSSKLNRYWKQLYHSSKQKMSRGANHVKKIITWARGDNWRRK